MSDIRKETMQELTPEARALLSKKLGIPPDQLAVKIIEMPEDFVGKLEKGEIEFIQCEAPDKPGKLSQFTGFSPYLARAGLGDLTLVPRPQDAPSILQECGAPVKLLLYQRQSPGDILMLTRALEDLHAAYPGAFITDINTPCMQLFDNNPHVTRIDRKDPGIMLVDCHAKLVNQANWGTYHYMHAFRQYLESVLNLNIPCSGAGGKIYLSEEEKVLPSIVPDKPYWIIDSGYKLDFTNKHWDTERYRQVVRSTPDITWVQVGAGKGGKNPDRHPIIDEPNVVRMVGKTDLRQLCHLMYHAAGVVTPVSLPMHLAKAVPVHPKYKRQHRPCVVIAGGREPATWEAYHTHQFLHVCGALPCTDKGGCWRARVTPVGDGDDKDYQDSSLCAWPVETPEGNVIPRCMDMITVDQVVGCIRRYLECYDYTSSNPAEWREKPIPAKPAVVRGRIAEIQMLTREGRIKRKGSPI